MSDSKAYIFVLPPMPRYTDMVKSTTLIVTALASVMVLHIAFAFIPVAEGHGVQAQLQSRFVRIQDEAFSAQTLQTGDEITVTGELQSLVNRPLRAWMSIFSESTNAGNRWEFVARDPPGNVFEIPPQATIPYELRAKALEPGVYHVHTQLNVAGVGPGLGPGQTVQVSGEPILKPVPWGNVAYQVILIGAGLGVTFATRPWQVI
ncbi:MAG TPA: methane monooxygenase/ammonia monooxygenase subunit B [Nitrososphaeraceae archaeon]|nr:methane monooxygenase/ammonia monooxygenase subunit B [Nitrososphaeraceae archaeon]